MGTSIDGRPHPSPFTAAAADVSPDFRRGHYEKLVERFEADGWIVGRKTMAEMTKGQQKSIADAPKLPREARISNRAGRFSPVVEVPNRRTDGTTEDGSAFRGKVTFVSGGGTGIGRTTAPAFARGINR